MGLEVDILDRIEVLRKERNWSERKLSKEAGLPQSTVASWNRKSNLPSIHTLMKICDAFGITLAEFFRDDDKESVLLTSSQIRLINAASKLDDEQYEALINFLDML